MLLLVPMATLSFAATMLALTGAPANAKDKSSASGAFNPQKNYSGVVLQQGRTSSDSDRTTSGSFSARKSYPGAMIQQGSAYGEIPLRRKTQTRSN
jgi:hypothetical protein